MFRNYKVTGMVIVLLCAVLVSFADSKSPNQTPTNKGKQATASAGNAPKSSQASAQSGKKIKAPGKTNQPTTSAAASNTNSAPVIKPTVKRTVTNSLAQNKKKDSDGVETDDGTTSVSAVSQSNSNGSGSSVGVIIMNLITILSVVGLIAIFLLKIRKISSDFEDNLKDIKNNMTTYVKNGLQDSGWDEMQSKIMSSGASSFPSGNLGQGQQQDILNAIYELRNDRPGQAATPQADFSQIINAINELKEPLSEAERQEERNRQLAADQEQINAAQQEHAQEIATLKAEHEKQLKETQDRQLAADQEQMNAKIAKLNSEHEKQLKEVQDNLKNQEKQSEDAQKTHAQEIATLKAELTAANENLKTQKANYEEQLTATQDKLIKESFPPAACEFRTWLEGQADLKSEKTDLVLHSLSRLEILSHGEDKKPCYDDLLRFDTLLWDTFGSDKPDADLGMLHKIRDELEKLLNEKILKDTEYQIKWAKPGIDINNEGDNYRIVDDIGHIVKVAVNGLVTKSGKVLQRSKVICCK